MEKNAIGDSSADTRRVIEEKSRFLRDPKQVDEALARFVGAGYLEGYHHRTSDSDKILDLLVAAHEFKSLIDTQPIGSLIHPKFGIEIRDTWPYKYSTLFTDLHWSAVHAPKPSEG